MVRDETREERGGQPMLGLGGLWKDFGACFEHPGSHGRILSRKRHTELA